MGDDPLSKSVQFKLERIQAVENWLTSAGQKPFAEIIGGARRSISSLTKTCSQLWHDNVELRKTADVAAAREADLRAEVERLTKINQQLVKDFNTQNRHGAKQDDEVVRLRGLLDAARRERDDALARLSRMCGDA